MSSRTNNSSPLPSSPTHAMNTSTASNMTNTMTSRGNSNNSDDGISSTHHLSSQPSVTLLPTKTENRTASPSHSVLSIPQQQGYISPPHSNPFEMRSGTTNDSQNLMQQQQNGYPMSYSSSSVLSANTIILGSNVNNSNTSSLLDMMLDQMQQQANLTVSKFGGSSSTKMHQQQRTILSNINPTQSQTNYHNMHVGNNGQMSYTNEPHPTLYNNTNGNSNAILWSNHGNIVSDHPMMMTTNTGVTTSRNTTLQNKSNSGHGITNKQLQFHVHHLSNVTTTNSPSNQKIMTNSMHGSTSGNFGTNMGTYSSGSSSSSSLLSLMTSDTGSLDAGHQHVASLPTSVTMTSNMPSSNQSSPHQQQYGYSSPQNNLSITPSNPQMTHSSQQIFYSGILPPLQQYSSGDSDSSDDSDDHTNAEDECEFHPIACVQCRQLHKKCDKRLPSCTKCVSRGVECTYRTPKRNTSQPQQKKKKKKKNRSKSSSNLTPYMPVIPNRAKSKIVDIYFTCLAADFPLFSRDELEYYLDEQKCPPGTPNKREVEVLFTVIRALVEQRCGTIEDAARAMLEARHALSTVFCHHSNFYVATAFCYMSFVESLNHDLKTAKFFLQCCEFYLESLANENALDDRAQLLKRAHAYAKISTCNNRISNDYSGNVMDMIKQIPQMYTLSTGQSLPPEFHDLVSQEITEHNYQEMLDVIDTLTKLMYAQSNMLTKTANSKPFSKIDLVYLFISNGLKIAILTKAGQRKDLIEECALRVTYTTYTDLYPFCSIDMISYVALAARVHLHIVRAIEAGQRSAYNTGITSLDGSMIGQIDYYEILAHDLRGINLLKRHLKNPSAYYDGLVNEITQILHKKGISVDNLQSSIQFSTLVDSLQNDLEAVAFSTDPVVTHHV
ncbi:hypothetical protein C9374_013766 [Naegleria lovaniensis]|uniref:Zn(2)-C6 fungal-type domain-containing protein n=1 Tax=Naegleria lovaniensis TaxID=51637 RepID=A0AA88GBP1_NAELO|nr:uncharacterized protein C9374_013766 [Naegleria lovaniensis]KAG2370891.1 hypothetical protein C9374_013766 [Naegleria lovaniensis]